MSVSYSPSARRMQAGSGLDPRREPASAATSSLSDPSASGESTDRGASTSGASTCAASPTDASSLRERLESLQNLDGAALRKEWRRLCRSEPPRISRDLLMRAVAYRLQELAFGGLPKWARQSLAGSAIASDPGETTPTPIEPRLKPGARLIREWHGRTHTVIVLDDAFEFEGRSYHSLTQIAREITGAHWSGPRFFGLTNRKGRSGSGEAQAEASAQGANEITEGAEPVERWSVAACPVDAGGRRPRGNRPGQEGSHG